MPIYDYHCDHCDQDFESRHHIVDYKVPETQPCPICFTENCVHIFIAAAPALGDAIRLGITRPPDAWMHGVLSRMEQSIPNGGMKRDSSGKIQTGQDGKPLYQKVSFSKARYSPNRLV